MKKPQKTWKEEEKKILKKIWVLFPEEAKEMLGRTDASISGKAHGMKIGKLPPRFRSIMKKRIGEDLEEVIGEM